MTKEKDIEDKQKVLIEILKRFDFYINTSNTKVTIILSYCVTCMIGIAIRYASIQSLDIVCWLKTTIFISFIIFLLLTLAIVFVTCRSLLPNTASGHADAEQKSFFFFGDVATFDNGRDGYTKAILDATSESILNDLAQQVHTLGTIANSKFAILAISIKLLVYLHIPSTFLFVILSVFANL